MSGDGDGLGPSLARLGSWLFLGVALLAFAFTLWQRFGTDSARGEWRGGIRGQEISGLTLSGPGGSIGAVRHPALVYFHDPECQPCSSASTRFRNFVEEASDPGAADARGYYVLIKPGSADTTTIAELDRRYPAAVETYLVRGFNRSLAFVRDVPMFVATDASARVRDAFVGIPDRSVFKRLLRRHLESRDRSRSPELQ